MKEIRLNVSDGVFERLRSAVVVRGISGSLHGIIDEFVYKIIKSVEEESFQIDFNLREEMEGKEQGERN